MRYPPKRNARELQFERQRITLLGTGLDREEPFLLQGLENPTRKVRARTDLMVQILSMYCRYDQGEKAAAVAIELMKVPSRYRAMCDVVVTKDLSNLEGQE